MRSFRGLTTFLGRVLLLLALWPVLTVLQTGDMLLGCGAVTFTQQMDNLFSTTWFHVSRTVADNVFNRSAYFAWLRLKGRMKEKRGGLFIQENLAYAQNPGVGWVAPNSAVSLADYQFITRAQQNWAYLVGPMVRSWIDDQKNSGMEEIMDLVMQKVENTTDAMVEQLEIALFGGQGTASNPPQIDGLQWFISNTPAVSAIVEGIDASIATWWQNQAINMTGQGFAANGIAQMRTLFNTCGRNRTNDFPDIVLATQAIHELYEDLLPEKERFTNQALGDLGFENIQFKGRPMVWSPQCPANQLYMANSAYVTLYYDPDYFFEMTEWKPIPAQMGDRAAQIVVTLSHVTNRRRTLGVLYNVSA